ncbi:MAG: tetratricopeptide repeat protein [Bacteroidales bacterium]
MNKAFYLPVFFFALGLYGQHYGPEDSIRLLYYAGDYHETINKSTGLIKHRQVGRDTWYYLGKAHAELYNYDSAAICFDNILKLDSTDLYALNALASNLIASRKPKKAEAIYRTILRIDPVNREARINLAGICSRLGNDKEAKSIFVNLHYENPDNLYFIYLLATSYSTLNLNDSAIFYYEKYLQGNCEDFASVIKLSGLYIKEGLYKKGFEITAKYLDYDSLNIPVLKLNAYFCFLLNNYDDAIKRFSFVASLGDSTFMTMKYLGLSFIRKEDMYLATGYLQKAHDLDTSDFETCMYLGISRGWTINKEMGIEYIIKAHRLINPPNETVVRIYRELADLYAAWGKPSEAIKYYMKILDFNTDNRLILFKLANVYENIDKQMALNWYHRFMTTRDPEHAAVKTNSEGLLVVSYYDIAEKRIKKLKEDQFFEGKMNTE